MIDNEDIKNVKDSVNYLKDTLDKHLDEYVKTKDRQKELALKVAKVAGLKTKDNSDIELVLVELLKKYVTIIINNRIDKLVK